MIASFASSQGSAFAGGGSVGVRATKSRWRRCRAVAAALLVEGGVRLRQAVLRVSIATACLSWYSAT
jgi:hypothetical protein